MLNRRREGAEMSDPVLREAGFEILAEAYPINHHGPGICCEPRWTMVSGVLIRD
jgi:hypothetical protein